NVIAVEIMTLDSRKTTTVRVGLFICSKSNSLFTKNKKGVASNNAVINIAPKVNATNLNHILLILLLNLIERFF
ncbi:MAG TPA: hypothetical protein DD733_07180, partial [Clostridiales bacterium]|nr:hypothetical protein [Clostridiales bacterium]